MAGALSFDINEVLKAYLEDPQAILTPDADPALLDCENDSDAYNSGAFDDLLNSIAEALGDSPEAVLRPTNIDSLQFILR